MHLIDETRDLSRRHSIVAHVRGHDLRGQFDEIPILCVFTHRSCPCYAATELLEEINSLPPNRPVSRSITIFKNYYLTSQPARTTWPPNATNIGKMRPGQEKLE